MVLVPKKLIFHSSSSSSSASVGSQKINTMDEDDAISDTPASIALDRISTQQVHNQFDKQKHSEEALEKTQEQEDDSTCVPDSKAREIALLDENQTTEAGKKEGNEPALDKISTIQMHNQADKHKQSQAVLEKTQEQGDSTCDPNSKIQEALLGENQTTESGEKEGDEPALDKLTALQMHNQADQQKQSRVVLGKTQEQGGSTYDPNSKIQEALSGKNQTSEAGEKESDEPALKKIEEREDSNSNSVGPQKFNKMDEEHTISEAPSSTALKKIFTQQVHNQADQQIHSDAALEKTQDKNQTIEVGEKEGEKAALEKTREQGSNSGFDFQSIQKNKAIMVVESLNPIENPLESNKLTDIQETNGKKPLALFSQIFTDDDVIVLLQGMIDFKSMHKDKNMTDFYFFIKDKLCTQFTKIQITEKFRRLRKKFVGNFKKTTENGAPRDFSNPYDSIVFELSNKLWGNDGCDKKPILEISEKTKRKRVEFGSKKEDKKQKGIVEDKVDIDMELKYPLVHPSFNQNSGSIAPDMVKKNWTLKGSTNSRYSEAKWGKLKIKEVELYCKKLDLMKEMIEAVLQSLKD